MYFISALYPPVHNKLQQDPALGDPAVHQFISAKQSHTPTNINGRVLGRTRPLIFGIIQIRLCFLAISLLYLVASGHQVFQLFTDAKTRIIVVH